jgi:transposase
MDESFLYAHHCLTRGWFFITDSLLKNEVRGDNKGKRIIILHAMTKYGMLTEKECEPSNILTEEYPSAELIFDEVCADDVTPEDYHNTINGEKFVAWMRSRLFPAFKKLFWHGRRRPRMILVLDNAKYHHHRGPEWISPYKMKRGQLADFLRQRSVPSITVEGGRVILSNKFSANSRSAGGPTLKQLKAAVSQHLAAHPEINTTVPQQLMEDQGFSLLYTPPYVCQLQPTEPVWAQVKRLVAQQSVRGRSTHEAAVQTRQAMGTIDAAYCQKVINHVHKWIDKFMVSEDGGSLRQFASLAALSDAPTPNELPMDVIRVLPPEDVSEDEEEAEDD